MNFGLVCWPSIRPRLPEWPTLSGQKLKFPESYPGRRFRDWKRNTGVPLLMSSVLPNAKKAYLTGCT